MRNEYTVIVSKPREEILWKIHR